MNNISMKNVIMGSVLAIAAVTSLPANAVSVAVCSGNAAGDGKTFASGTVFVKIAFTPKCSANVLLAGDEVNSTLFAVGSASTKGRNMFAGSTAGGAVGNVGKCAADPCATGSEKTAIEKAPS
jgi:hypothetical protein